MVAEAMMKKEIHGEWLEKVDNLFTALDIYRDVENLSLIPISEPTRPY